MSTPATSNDDLAIPVKEGDVLGGKYRVERVLGTGGMGVVVAAMHLQLDERVALKFLLPAALKNPEAVARFAREARAAAKIRSEHVARVFDVGTLDNGAPHMVMEYLEGDDLSVVLEKRSAVEPEAAVEYILQACEAIAEAHAFGIVHRDLKPGNLFLTTRADGTPSIKVLDFGISKMADRLARSEGALTRTRSVMGSPLYMAPEQMRASKQVDPRSDIWALGMILAELIGGTTPFDGDTIPEICISIINDPPKISERAPEGLRPVLLRCLEKEAADRYQTVGELANALAPFGPARSHISVDRVAGVLGRASVTSGSLEPPPTSVDPPRAAISGLQSGRFASETLDAAHAPKLLVVPKPPSRTFMRSAVFAGGVAIGAAGIAYLVLSRTLPNAASADQRPAETAAHASGSPSGTPLEATATTAPPPPVATAEMVVEPSATAVVEAPQSASAPHKDVPARATQGSTRSGRAAATVQPAAPTAAAPVPSPTPARGLFDDPK